MINSRAARSPLQWLARGSALLQRLVDGLGRLAGWLVFAMALATALIVLLRYYFGFGSIALQEGVTYLHATVFMVGAAYAAQRDQHVRVDIFYRRFSRRGQLWVNLIGTLVFLLPVMALLFFYSLDYVVASWALGERSADGGGLAYRYLLKSLLLVLPALMALHALSTLIDAALELASQPLPAHTVHSGGGD